MTSKKSLQPLDRTALALMLVLGLLIGLLVFAGDRTVPRVRDFSWQDKQVGAEDTSFILTFSRPMDRTSVESNLKIEPLIPGKISWAGRRMAYTLTSSLPYGTKFKLELDDAKEQLAVVGGERVAKLIQPFRGDFSTRDRAFVYLGVEGEEKGRLILYNLTHQQKNILTPPDMVVTDFKPYPEGDKILFSAANWLSNKPGVFEQQLYTVTTGINPQSPGKADPQSQPPGRVNLILDSKDYQNMKFDLSPDGQTVVVQRVKRGDPGQFGLWVVQENSPPEPLGNQPGGDFLIAPDSKSVALAQGEGMAILPLTPAAKPLDFLPGFAQVYSFARDGSAAAMMKFNPDYTRSLFMVTNQGVQKELLQTTGSILDAQFDPLSTTLYCLLTELKKGKEYKEEPYLAAIDLKTYKITPLLLLPGQQNTRISLAPDSLALIFDQVATGPGLPNEKSLTTDDGQAIVTGRLWVLPLADSPSSSTRQQQPQELPLPGYYPRWLP